jgi:hypothetical protein
MEEEEEEEEEEACRRCKTRGGLREGYLSRWQSTVAKRGSRDSVLCVIPTFLPTRLKQVRVKESYCS